MWYQGRVESPPEKPRRPVHLPLFGQLREHVSFSELKLFSECQWRWLLKKVAGHDTKDESFQMDFGKAIHAGMEVLYGPGGTVDAATAVASQMYEEGLKKYVDMHPSDAAEAERIKGCVREFYRDCLACPELQGITTLRSELKLFEDIGRTDGLELKFKGFIDIVFVKKMKRKTVIYIADFKTCQWGWPRDRLGDITVTAQILLYKHFFCKLTGADPKNVKTAFVLLKKRPAEDDIRVQVLEVSPGPKMVTQAIEFMQRTITEMHGYTYEQNFNACRREWTDRDTKEVRHADCQFLGSDLCPGSAEAWAGS